MSAEETSLVFSKDDPCNTTITERGRIAYVVETRREASKSGPNAPIVIYTDVYDGHQLLIATLRWNDLASDTVTWTSKGWEGEPLSNWLKKNILPFNRTATFKDDQDRKFKWDKNGPHRQFQLLAEDKERIAYFDRAQPYVHEGNPVATPSRLVLTSRAETMREMVVLSFLFLEKDRRQTTSRTEKRSERQTWGATQA